VNIITIATLHRHAVLTGLLTTLVLLPAASAPAQENPNPGIYPPDSRPYGHSYGRWSARWWQYAYSLPVNYNPLTDTAPVSAGQRGDVWYLGGSFISTTNPSTGAEKVSGTVVYPNNGS
jgi:hypothetical protein